MKEDKRERHVHRFTCAGLESLSLEGTVQRRAPALFISRIYIRSIGDSIMEYIQELNIKLCEMGLKGRIGLDTSSEQDH